jgi:hypothetical protein
MKTNFKKLALTAGVTAALAVGSMSAQAVITAVPAPAQLVPLFYWSDSSAAGEWDTSVRITVPKAVGFDTVINLLSNAAQPGGIQPSDSWNTQSEAFKPTVIGGNTVFANYIHWYWMDNRSEELQNGVFPVTPDDSVYLSARAVYEAAGGAGNGRAGYLILGNESAYGGGAPEFQFAADAWVENTESTAYPDTFSIPVLGLADDADTTAYPTPTNNLIEAYAAPAKGPIASPIHTGMRTSSTAFTSPYYRVIDVPIHNTMYHTNTLVAWADRNGELSGISAGLGNGLSGRAVGIGPDEEFSSLPAISMPNQLNIIRLGNNWSPSDTTIGLANSCASGTCVTTSAVDAQVANYANLGEAAKGGFMKLILDPVKLPVGTLAAGAYSSVILFNVPGLAANAPVGTDNDAPNLGIDTGFFTKN